MKQKPKKCNTCGETLPRSKFYKNRRMKDGLNSKCISCSQEYRRQVTHSHIDLGIPVHDYEMTYSDDFPIDMS